MPSGTLNCGKEINPPALGPDWAKRTVDSPLKFKAPDPLLIWTLYKLCFGRGSESKFLGTRICPDRWPEPRECSRVCVHSEDRAFYQRDYSLIDGERATQQQSADRDAAVKTSRRGDSAV